jgi:hypothetical protein
MKTVTYGNLKKKYENKKTYLMHYQLLEHKAKGWGMMLRVNLFLFLGFYLLLHRYPITLATLDFTFTVLSLVYIFYFKPNILRGKIKAYYRRDYRDMKTSIFLMQLFIQGGVIRFAVLSLFYGLTFYLVKDNPRDVEKYKEVVLEILINPTVSAIAIGAFAIAIYLLFYHEKYVSIREFSNSVVEIYSYNSYTEEGAVNEFIRRKDGEYELGNINGVKYDGNYSTSSQTTYTHDEPDYYPEQATYQEASGNEKASSIHEEPKKIVRRKARK